MAWKLGHSYPKVNPKLLIQPSKQTFVDVGKPGKSVKHTKIKSRDGLAEIEAQGM